MIKAILVFNNSGKPRLLKFYEDVPEEIQQKLLRETFLLVSRRDDDVCNFLEGGSELGILDLIQVFVEALDKSFESVCELDLIFHPDKVHYLLNELVVGGMVLETHISEIVNHYEEQNKLEKQEQNTLSATPARAVSAVKDLNIPQKLKDIKLPDIPYLNSRLGLG